MAAAISDAARFIKFGISEKLCRFVIIIRSNQFHCRPHAHWLSRHRPHIPFGPFEVFVIAVFIPKSAQLLVALKLNKPAMIFPSYGSSRSHHAIQRAGVVHGALAGCGQ
jgi:hypothetical protein